MLFFQGKYLIKIVCLHAHQKDSIFYQRDTCISMLMGALLIIIKSD